MTQGTGCIWRGFVFAGLREGAVVIGVPGFDVQGLLAELCDAFYFAAFLGGFQGVVDGVHFGLGFGGRGGFKRGVALGGLGARVTA